MASCHRALPTPPRPAPPAANESPAPTSVSAEAAFGRCPDDPSVAEREFCDAAFRAVRAVVEEDSDDAAPLLALLNALETSSQLPRLSDAWHAPLSLALTRAHTLAALARPLRQLRRAVLDAYLDPRTGLYRGVDNAACRAAFVELGASDADWQEVAVTLEPLGTYTLSSFRRFCLESRTLERPLR